MDVDIHNIISTADKNFIQERNAYKTGNIGNYDDFAGPSDTVNSLGAICTTWLFTTDELLRTDVTRLILLKRLIFLLCDVNKRKNSHMITFCLFYSRHPQHRALLLGKLLHCFKPDITDGIFCLNSILTN